MRRSVIFLLPILLSFGVRSAVAGVIAVGAEGSTVLISDGGLTNPFSISSLGPSGGATVTLHDLAFDPSTNGLLLMTNGGLFRRTSDGSFLNTNILGEFHGHDSLAISTVPEPATIAIWSLLAGIGLDAQDDGA